MPQLKDKFFEPFLTHRQILDRVSAIAEKINEKHKDSNPLIIGVLKGAYRFLGDLSTSISVPCEISFIRVASYFGTERVAQTKEILGLTENVKGRKIILVEDIVDSGNTIDQLLPQFQKAGASSVEICTLLLKPKAYQFNHPVDYIGFEIPNEFVVGYGLDYDGAGRCWNDICKLPRNS